MARTDDTLQRELEALLSREARDLGVLRATVDERVVTLEGDPSPADVRLTDTLVRGVPEVLAVGFR